MQFHWIRDRIKQKQFCVTWRKGAHNLADFFTKALPVRLHKVLMPLLVRIPPTPLWSKSGPRTEDAEVGGRGGKRRARRRRVGGDNFC